MGTGQVMLSLGAMALLATSTISMHRGYNASYQQVIQSKLGITAVSLASSIIEEANGKAFDAHTQDTSVTLLSKLTPVASLGKETGEFYPDSLDDFDDFNNLPTIKKDFADTVYGKPYGGGTFYISCKVVYVNPSNPDVASATPTWDKKLTVTVTSPDMVDTIRQSYIFGYWYF
jgi:hypothetical protein